VKAVCKEIRSNWDAFLSKCSEEAHKGKWSAVHEFNVKLDKPVPLDSDIESLLRDLVKNPILNASHGTKPYEHPVDVSFGYGDGCMKVRIRGEWKTCDQYCTRGELTRLHSKFGHADPSQASAPAPAPAPALPKETVKREREE
jgi:hypothetical protein